MTINTLSKYFFGVIAFTKSINLNGYKYIAGDEIHVSPSVLHLFVGGKLPKDSFKLVLRKLEQLEDSEVIALSLIVAPRKNFNDTIRTVSRQGKKDRYTIEVHIAESVLEQYTVVIDSKYNIAISHIITPPAGGKPIITHLAVSNQIDAFEWMLQKNLDVYGLIPKKIAASRKKWTAKGYEGPNHSRFSKND